MCSMYGQQDDNSGPSSADHAEASAGVRDARYQYTHPNSDDNKSIVDTTHKVSGPCHYKTTCRVTPVKSMLP
jgi:hypothetical protein